MYSGECKEKSRRNVGERKREWREGESRYRLGGYILVNLPLYLSFSQFSGN